MPRPIRPIRFFATNRDRQNLGRNVDRRTRIQLQKGGYHWVDMKKYMAHYLATTDPSTMPPDAIIEDSKDTIFASFLNKPAVKRIIIGIHGFNVPFHGALTSFSMMAETLGSALTRQGSTLITDPILSEEYIDDSRAPSGKKLHLHYDAILNDPGQNVTAFVGFSWPSNGRVLDYLSDRAEAVQTAPALANLISCIRFNHPQLKVHIIAHSMGNYLTCKMLQGLVDKTLTPIYTNDTIRKQIERQDLGGANEFFIDRYLMLAPDVERREVTQCDIAGDKSAYLGPFYAGLKHLIQEVNLFYSRHDTALKASVLEKDLVHESVQKGVELLTGPDLTQRWESSLGLNSLPSLAPPNMFGHNATALTNRTIDHGDYFDSRDVMELAAQIILGAG